MARWIHEFRSAGERVLAESERPALRRQARLPRLVRLLAVLAAVDLPLGVVLGIAIAANPNPIGWAVLGGSVVLFFYLVSWANAAEKLALLHRRALRLGTVEECRRVPGDETAKNLWTRVGIQEEEDEEGGTLAVPTSTYWSLDERFEEALRRAAGGPVGTFTTVGRDGAILWVEGRPVRKLLEPPVWEVAG